MYASYLRLNMPKSRFPVSDPIPSVWTHPSEWDDYCSTPKLPEQCDILIVGSGFAGVATAYHLQNSSHSLSIVLVDARKHCSGATARNGGHVKPDTYYNVSKYEKLYGTTEASALANLEASGVYAMKQLVESEGLNCDFHLTRAIDVYMDPNHARDTIAAYKSLLERGQVDLRDVAYTPRRDAERVSQYRPVFVLSNGLLNYLTDLWCQRRPMLFQLHRSASLAEKNGAAAIQSTDQTGCPSLCPHPSSECG